MLSIPFMNSKSTDKTRAVYLSELRRAGADRAFIFVSNTHDDSELEASTAQLKENIDYYRENGLEVGVWITGFGHGGEPSEPIRSRTAGFTQLVGLHSGKSAGDSFCPLDEAYLADYLNFVSRICEQGPTLLMIDDDLRLSSHGAVDIGCACELHLAELSRRLGREIGREELAAKVFTREPNELRKLWLEVMRDTLLDFGKRVRETIDLVDPSIRAGQCACITTWDADGADAIELSRVLAGKNRPFMRLIGAPYWNNSHFMNTVDLGGIIETERMQLSWCRENAPDIEVFTEGDAYPRPRYNTPAAFIEGFDQALLADGGAEGILKYMLDYNQTPLYETGYIDRHVRDFPLREQIKAHFSGKAEGIYCFEPIKLDLERDCSVAGYGRLLSETVRPSTQLCAACSIPVTYERDEHSAAMVFGEAARHIDDYFQGVPLIIDVAAAEILGDEVSGLRSSERLFGVGAEAFGDERISVSSDGLCKVELCADAEVLSRWIVGNSEYPAVWRYVNHRGQRILGYAFYADIAVKRTPLCLSYARQRQLSEAVKWLQGYPLPAQLPKNTDLYILCKRDGGRLSVGLWNFGLDDVLTSNVKLDHRYRAITPIGRIPMHLEGDSVVLEDAIPPFGFAGFEVEL